MAGERELEFLGTLGRGGFGTVYLANLHGRDRFVRRVAVKILRHAGDVDGVLVARQRDEARLLGLLSNEGIVQVLDLTEIEGRPAVVMEYVEGADVAEVARVLRERGVDFPVRAAFEIVAATAAALDAAWSSPSPVTGDPLHVIHRDIKPANLVLTARGGLKVLDFGIARAEFNRDGVTGSGFFGTPAYMAPEFWIQEPIGPAYDLFALGVSLLELLSGQPADRAPMEAGRFSAWREQRTAPLALPEPALALLKDLLAYDARDRPTAGAVYERAADVAGSLAGDSLSRFSRGLIPELVDARGRNMDTDSLPSRASLGVVSGPAIGPAAGEVLATARQPWAPPRSIVQPRGGAGPRWSWVVAGGVVAGAAALVTLALGGFVWLQPVVPVDEAATVEDVADVAAAGTSAAPPTGAAPLGAPIPAGAAGSGGGLGLTAAPVAVSPLGPQVVSPLTSPGGQGASGRGAPRILPRGSSPGGPGLADAAGVPAGSPVVRAAQEPGTVLAVDPSPSAAIAPASPTGDAESPAPPAPPAPAAVHRPVAFGCTVVGAALVIDGAPAGRTPRAAVSLADGSHLIVATSGDASCQKTIEVGADQPVGYVCDLSSQTWTARL